MLFSSSTFLFLFLPLLVILYYFPLFWKKLSYKNAILLIASICFYAWGEPVFIFILLLSIIINYFLAIAVEEFEKQKIRKILLVIAILYDIGMLFICKYLFWTEQILSKYIHFDNLVRITLPLGISFFTFQILSYVIDVYMKKVKAQRNFADLALYVIMFPQLIAGPIVRYSTIEKQLRDRKESVELFCEGTYRFAIGFCKKILIADYMALITDNIFSLQLQQNVSVATAWLGAIAYTLQIYFDFSGYSDMAIGLGSMFGFSYMENFKFPYIAGSITEFWHRWHISLSEWFRDYVYIPLGGNRRSTKRTVLNLVIVWILTGIWHGANWTFVVWGFIYAIFIIGEKLLSLKCKKKMKGSHLYTMLIVILLWVIFRAESLTEAFNYISNMFLINSNTGVDNVFIEYMKNCWIVLTVSIILCIPIKDVIVNRLKNCKTWYAIYQVLSFLILFFFFALAITVSLKATYSPFVYFNF